MNAADAAIAAISCGRLTHGLSSYVGTVIVDEVDFPRGGIQRVLRASHRQRYIYTLIVGRYDYEAFAG